MPAPKCCKRAMRHICTNLRASNVGTRMCASLPVRDPDLELARAGRFVLGGAGGGGWEGIPRVGVFWGREQNGVDQACRRWDWCWPPHILTPVLGPRSPIQAAWICANYLADGDPSNPIGQAGMIHRLRGKISPYPKHVARLYWCRLGLRC